MAPCRRTSQAGPTESADKDGEGIRASHAILGRCQGSRGGYGCSSCQRLLGRLRRERAAEGINVRAFTAGCRRTQRRPYSRVRNSTSSVPKRTFSSLGCRVSRWVPRGAASEESTSRLRGAGYETAPRSRGPRTRQARAALNAAIKDARTRRRRGTPPNSTLRRMGWRPPLKA